MVENTDNLLTRLKNGEKVLCEECKKGYLIPFNTTPDKAHSFICSNENCDMFVRTIPIIPGMDEILFGDLEK